MVDGRLLWYPVGNHLTEKSGVETLNRFVYVNRDERTREGQAFCTARLIVGGVVRL